MFLKIPTGYIYNAGLSSDLRKFKFLSFLHLFIYVKTALVQPLYNRTAGLKPRLQAILSCIAAHMNSFSLFSALVL